MNREPIVLDTQFRGQVGTFISVPCIKLPVDERSMSEVRFSFHRFDSSRDDFERPRGRACKLLSKFTDCGWSFTPYTITFLLYVQNQHSSGEYLYILKEGKEREKSRVSQRVKLKLGGREDSRIG